MVAVEAILPATPERSIPLRGLALAALLHAGVAGAAVLLDYPAEPEVPVFEIAYVLPEPAPVPQAPEPAERTAAAPPPPAAAEPEPPPEPLPPAQSEPEPEPVPDAPAAIAAPPPRPAAKPHRPEPAAAPAPAPPQPSIEQMLAALPAPPVDTTATQAATAPATIPAPQPAAPAIPPMQVYAARLRNLLAQHQEYPRAARQRHQEGVVRIALTIDRTGRLTDLRLHGSSSVAVLDDAALAMARRAAPFPPPPLEPQQRQAVFVVPVGFTLED